MFIDRKPYHNRETPRILSFPPPRPHAIRENEKREEEAELMERVASANLDDAAASAAVAAADGPTLTGVWKRAAKDGKGAFLMSTFKECFDSIKPGGGPRLQRFWRLAGGFGSRVGGLGGFAASAWPPPLHLPALLLLPQARPP
jgi:hypothetical protein